MRYFVSIIDENSFTEAAEKNYISQSAISQALNSLEKELGVKLIERKNRSFSVTTAGEYFYRKSKAFLSELENNGEGVCNLYSTVPLLSGFPLR